MTAARLSRKEKQQQTRDAIIEAATTLFASHGVEGTSMEAIARHAGMTQGAIYSNFASKADLWWAIGDQTSRTLDLNEMFGADRPLRDELADVGRAVWQLLRSASRTELLLAQEFDLYLMRHPRQRAKYAREVREDQRRLASLLERGAAERGETLSMDSEQLARTIEAIAYGLLHTFMLDPRSVDEEFCVGAFASLAAGDVVERLGEGPGRPSSVPRKRTTLPPITFMTSSVVRARLQQCRGDQRQASGSFKPGDEAGDVETLDDGVVTPGRPDLVLDLLEEVRTDSDVVDAGHRGDVFDVVDEPIDGVLRLVNEAGEEVHTDHAATCGDRLELSVAEVAVVIADHPRLECVAITGRVAISRTWSTPAAPRCETSNNDAESLHLGDRRHAGVGQATAGGVLATSVGEGGPPEVGQRGDPDAQPVHRPEQLDVGVDRRAALQRQHEGDATGTQRRVDRRTIETQLHRIGVALGDPLRRFDHPQRLAQRALGR